MPHELPPKGFIYLPWVAITCHGHSWLLHPRSTSKLALVGGYAAQRGDRQRIPGEQHRANLLPGVRTETPSVTLHRHSLSQPSPQRLGWLCVALASLRCQTCEGPCSEVCAPGGRPKMADKACLCGNDSPGLTRSISIPCSASENSCITHLATKGCKTQLTLSLPVSRDSLWPYPGSVPA